VSFEQIDKKIREARFFFDKMITQEAKAFGDKEPFDFYLSAFLSATRTIDYRLRHEHKTTYPAWRTKWDAGLKAEARGLIKFLVDDRNFEVHASGSGRDVKEEKIPVHGSYSDSSGTLTAGGMPATLSGVAQPAVVVKPTYSFTIDNVERKVAQACGEYLLLLEKMVADFKADHS
jgi:hypothetical protein